MRFFPFVPLGWLGQFDSMLFTEETFRQRQQSGPRHAFQSSTQDEPGFLLHGMPITGSPYSQAFLQVVLEIGDGDATHELLLSDGKATLVFAMFDFNDCIAISGA